MGPESTGFWAVFLRTAKSSGYVRAYRPGQPGGTPPSTAVVNPDVCNYFALILAPWVLFSITAVSAE